DAAPLPLGLDQARMDAVDLHAVLLAEVRQTFGEGRNCGIDRAADGESLFGLASAGSADRDQGAAALLEQRPGGARQPHMREEFQCVAFLPVGIGEGEKVTALGGPGIIDKNIEATEFASRRLDQCRGSARLAQVVRAHRSVTTLGPYR